MAERRALPHGMTPRLLTKEQASAYCNMTTDSFEAKIRAHVPPVPFSTRPLLWDVRALDRWLDEQSGVAGGLVPIEELIGRLGGDRARARR